MNEKKRLDYLDIAKAIALILVIVGHSFRDEARVESEFFRFLYDLIYRFQTSALFLVSGICFGLGKPATNVGSYALKKAKSYLLPFFTYSMLIYALFAAAYCVPPVRSILNKTSYTLVSLPEYLLDMLKNENPYSFHLWYLLTLFMLTMTAALINRYCAPKAALIIKLSLILLAPLASAPFVNDMCWTIKGYTHQLTMFMAGAVLSDGALRKYRKPLLIAGGVVFAVTAAQIGFVSDISWLGKIAKEYYVRASALFIGLGIVALALTLENRLSMLARFGRRSMPVYLYHQPLCCAFVGTVLYSYFRLPAAPVMLVCIVLSMVVPFVICFTIRALRLKRVADLIGLPY